MPDYLFNKVAGLRSTTLFKKRLWHRCFPVNFVTFLRTPFFTEHIWATASAHVRNLLLLLILESVSMIVLICCKNMTIIFSKSVSDFLFVQIVSYCIGKKHLKKYFM